MHVGQPARDMHGLATMEIYFGAIARRQDCRFLDHLRAGQRAQRVTQRVVREGFNNGAVNDALIEEAAAELANKASQRVTDVVYPARVLSVTDNVVTVNRGEQTGIAPNQRWEVFATGKELTDPDTGEVLGREEIKMGEIEITDVLPKFSKARIVGEKHKEQGPIMGNAQQGEFKHLSMGLEFLLCGNAKWRVALKNVPFQKGDIVELGEKAEAAEEKVD